MKLRIMTAIFALLFFGVQGAAAEMKVVFFPSGAEVSESRTFSVEKNVDGNFINFELPGQARPETLTVSTNVKGISISDISWTRDNLSEPQAVITVRKLLAKALDERDSVSAKINAIDGGIEYWRRGSPDDVKKTALSEKIADLVVANLSEFYAKRAKFVRELSEKEKVVKELSNKLREVSGFNRNVWKVQVSFSGKTVAKTMFDLRYMVDNCGWSPVYSLDAYPDHKQVKFSFDAQIRQAAGFDLKNADIELATIRPQSRISPPLLPAWVIKPKVENVRRLQAVNEMAMMKSSAVSLEQDFAPIQQQKSTYSIWKLGKRNLPAGVTRKFNLEKEVWAADFSYLARPSLGPDVFVSAKVKHNEAMDLPSGKTFVFMEGTMLGKKQLDLTGKEVEMFFGSDPFVKSEFKTVEKASGEKGLFGSGQTYSWKYEITLINNRKNMRTVRVEEPLPVSGDKRIELDLSSTPEAETKDHKFIWNVKAPASEKTVIKYGVELKAPADMKLDFGVRR